MSRPRADHSSSSNGRLATARQRALPHSKSGSSGRVALAPATTAARLRGDARQWIARSLAESLSLVM
ncbi:hypothetical protein ACR5KS_11690 [Leucobacter sp. W1153]|uniref:hypothetical protein n=1 Tax=Leucobacter sp. W1153 TaxID=3439064 RepID=UPI003F324E11